MFKLSLSRLLFFAFFVSFASQAAQYQSHQLQDGRLTIQTDRHQLTLTPLDEKAIEVAVDNGRAQLPSFAKQPNLASKKAVPMKLIERKDALVFSTKSMTALVHKSPVRIEYFYQNKPLVAEELGYFQQRTIEGFRFALTDEEKILGGGERVVGMDRRGLRLPLYNRAHYGYETEAPQMNFSIPAIISSKKYLILYDNPANGWLDIGATNKNVLQFEANGGRQSYILMAGDSYPELIKQYVGVTGTQPLPPRWALGNHASRFGYRSQSEVLDTIAQYKADDIPVDSVILDLYWFGKDIKGHMGNLDWDPDTFPKPKEMIQSLKDDGVKTVLITEPFILTGSKKWQEAVEANALGMDLTGIVPRTFDFYFGNTGLVDVFSQPGQDWFSQIYTDLADQGVAGVWGDLGEPEVHPADMLHTLKDADNLVATGDEVHNVYGHQWGEMVHKALAAHNPEQRQFMIMRAGYAGSQRLGMIPWTGDVNRSWRGLKPQVELSLQMGLLGMAYTHSDLGGFAGDNYDPELYTRWLQYGVFQPIYRPHAQDSVPSEPVFHDEQTKNIVRDFIKLRYAMLPYNYTLAYENSLTGMPLMRPMFFGNESDLSLLDEKQQYMWGDSFLVKPVTDAGVISSQVKLPAGNWFDFWSDKKYQGNQTVTYPVSLETIPVLVKGGAIIPTVAPVQSTDLYRSNELKLAYYFDSEVTSSSAQMYEDDGRTANAMTKGQFELLNFSSRVGEKEVTFDLTRTKQGQGYPGQVQKRQIELTVHNWSLSSQDITIDGKPMATFVSQKEWQSANTGAYFDHTSKQLKLKLSWDHSDTRLNIK